jgi:hypothetical protein
MARSSGPSLVVVVRKGGHSLMSIQQHGPARAI